MNYQNLAEEFWAQGYLVIDGFFDPALANELDELTLAHFRAHPVNRLSDEFTGKAKTDIIPWLPQDDGPSRFDAIDQDPRLAALTDAVIGPGWIHQHCLVMFSGQGTKGQAWHQDSPPEHKRDYNLNRLLYSRDILDEVGGQLAVVPGTHLGGALPVGEPHGDFPTQVVLRPRKGTLVLLHGHCWHRVFPIHGKFRTSINYRAIPAGVSGEVTDTCVYRNMRYHFPTRRIVEDRAIDSAAECP